MSSTPTFKIFRNLTTLDTLSLGRDSVWVRIPPLWSAFVLVLPDGMDEEEVCKVLGDAYGLVEYAHLNTIARPSDTSPPRPRTYDPFYGPNQASLHPAGIYTANTPGTRAHVNVEPAWQYAWSNGSGVKVGVMDTGIDADHPELLDASGRSRVIGGWDYVNNQPYTLSTDSWRDFPTNSGATYWGHGTQAAGIIGASRNNQDASGNYVGVAGIASGVSFYSLRVFGNAPTDAPPSSSSPFAGLDRAAEGIADAALNTGSGRNFGVNLMNHSWGSALAASGTSGESVLTEAVRAAYYNKVTLVASRGNHGEVNNQPELPANIESVISVSATGVDGNFKTNANGELNNADDVYTSKYARADGSGRIDIAAPGTRGLVYTTGARYDNGTVSSVGVYDAFNGTSAAAPHVTGAAALLLGMHPGLHPEDVKEILKKTALPKSFVPATIPATATDLYGAGLLDIGRAVLSTRGAYQIQHFVATDATAQRTTIASGVNIILTKRAGALANGLYAGDVIQSDVQASHNLNGTDIAGSWARSSASAPYSHVLSGGYYGIIPYGAVQLLPGTVDANGAVLRGYFYHITGTPQAPTSFLLNNTDVWVPYNPNTTNGDYAYTVWTRDPLYSERNAPGDEPTEPVAPAARAYPNPSTQQAWIEFKAHSTGEQARLELVSIAGKSVAIWQHTATRSGWQSEALPLTDLPAGVYLCRIQTAEGVSVTRVIKK